MRKFFIFGVPVKINSFSPIPEDDEELSLPELIYWASLGDLEQVKQLLIDREDPNQTDDEGYTALQAAAENDHCKRPLNPIPILIRFRFPTVWQ